MDVKIDETGSDDQSARVESFIGAGANLVGQRHFSHASIAQQDVHRSIDLRRRIEVAPLPADVAADISSAASELPTGHDPRRRR